MNEEHVIECQGLTKRFGGQLAVEALDWQVPTGTVTALLGPNGAGKTTTLRMLVNLLSPTRGQARVFGKPARKLGEADFARLGYISESQGMPTWMTVRYFLNYLKPMYPTWDEAFCDRLLKLFELPLDRKMSGFSRGMRMKAAFVSSLAYRPELLLLDEPFSGLDSIVREDLLDALLDLTEQERWTIVVSSHDIDDIERLVDHVAILNHGRLLLNAPIEGIQSRYRQISFLVEENDRMEIEATWLAYARDGKRVSFIESQFVEGETVPRLRERYSDLKDLTVEPMTLKQAYVAMLRARKESASPNQLIAS